MSSSKATPPRSTRPLRSIQASVLCFALLYTVSAWLYPGGYHADHYYPHYHVLYNFVCDSFHLTDWYNGRPNRFGGTLAIAAVAVLIFGALMPLWLFVPSWLTERRLALRLMPPFGITATLCLLVIPFEIVIEFPFPHFVAVLIAAVPAWLATVAVMLLSLKHPQIGATMRVVALLILSGTVVLVTGYVMVAAAGITTPGGFAVAQKILLLLLLFWLYRLGGLLAAQAAQEKH